MSPHLPSGCWGNVPQYHPHQPPAGEGESQRKMLSMTDVDKHSIPFQFNALLSNLTAIRDS